MADMLRTFSDADLAALRAVIRDRDDRSLSTTNRPGKQNYPPAGPECYVIRSPQPDGIPALSVGSDAGTGTGTTETLDDVPGKCTNCQVYQLIDNGTPTFYAVPGFIITVYNLSIAIPAGKWIPVTRDKYGKWYVPNMGLDFGSC